MWMTSCSEAMGWGYWVIFEKKQLAEIWNCAKRVDFRASARRGQLGLRDALHVVGSDGAVSIVKILSLSLSLHVSKNLKVKKVRKVSYLNYRESSVFRDFLCIFHIFVIWSYLEYTTHAHTHTHTHIYIWQDLSLNNWQRLICNKTQLNKGVSSWCNG